MVNQATAKSACVANGAQLASVHSAEEMEFLKGLRDGTAWLGLEYIGNGGCSSSGKWQWVDGSNFDYQNWRSGEPNGCGSGEPCASYYSDKTWNDNSCVGVRYTICKK